METLTEHHLHGRLSVEELDRRQRAALEAATRADLAALLGDLPRRTSIRMPLAGGNGWWTLDPKVRARRVARAAATAVSLAAGGVLVASANTQSDETGFGVGLAAAALGYLTHVVITKWPGKGH
jgi:DNA-binding transcriptional MocR family regulator